MNYLHINLRSKMKIVLIIDRHIENNISAYWEEIEENYRDAGLIDAMEVDEVVDDDDDDDEEDDEMDII